MPSFAPFTAQHAIALAVGTALTAALIHAGRRGGRSERIARSLLAFLNLTAFGLTAWAWSRMDLDSLDNLIPLHLCDLAAFLAGIALITGNRGCALLTYFWGLAGTLQGLITPAIHVGFPHPAAFAFFIHHFVVVAAALYFPLALGWRPSGPWWRAPLIAFFWLNAYLPVALLANHLLDTNFAFLAGPPPNPSLLDHLGPHPWYILPLEALALTLFLLLALPLRRRN